MRRAAAVLALAVIAVIAWVCAGVIRQSYEPESVDDWPGP